MTLVLALLNQPPTSLSASFLTTSSFSISLSILFLLFSPSISVLISQPQFFFFFKSLALGGGRITPRQNGVAGHHLWGQFSHPNSPFFFFFFFFIFYYFIIFFKKYMTWHPKTYVPCHVTFWNHMYHATYKGDVMFC